MRVIIPYPPGGGAEAAARFLVNHFTQAFGQSFVIDNRPGGNTVIGAEAAAKAVPDGYTLFFTGGSTMSLQPLVFAGKLPFDPLADFAPVGQQVRAGSLKVLAATSQQRSGFLPDVPTVAELGNPGYEIVVWFGLFAPAGTAPEIVARLNAEARKYLASPEAKEAYGKVGHEPIHSAPETVRARIIAEQKAFAKAVKDAKLKPE